MAQTTINSTTVAVAGQEISIYEPTFGSNRAQEPQRASSSPIENLPLELVQMILSFLPGPRALRTAVLSCPLFYYSFLGFKESITTQVLLNRIDISVLPEAMMSLEASELRSMNRASAHFYCMIHEITVDHLRQRPTARRSWSFLEALHLERRHAIVEELSQDFISRSFKAIERRFELYFERPGWKATHNERRRIERALYRYDIFSAMFSRGCGETEGLAHDYGYQEDGFFQYFAPWENEQLSCIHHHVERRARKSTIIQCTIKG
ncbi:hypothetical protein GGS24DRAFT_482946 [Hypoxylon argillaceum]|nr:hypothetical protein GGS24DRAFT_482946 [Hypoxylon argillaceum]